MAGHEPMPEACDACGYETADLTEKDAYARVAGAGPFTPENEKMWGWLCDVCRNTMVGNAWLYPRNYDPMLLNLGSAINYGTNLILDEVRKGR